MSIYRFGCLLLSTRNVTAWGHLPAEGWGRATQQARNLLMTLDDVRTVGIRYLIRDNAGYFTEAFDVLVVPALYLAHDTTLDWFAAYAHAGGHLVLGPRTGYADHEARARHEPAPGRLVKAAGVRYDEFSNLMRDVPLRAVPGSPLHLPDGATATRWADGLTVDDAEVLAGYDHPHFGRWPAVTTRRHGAGRVTYVGTVPGRDLAQALATWLAPSAAGGWQDLPASVTATTGTSPDGRRVHIVHNWSWEPARVVVPVELSDVLDGSSVPAGAALNLGAWDVRVFAAVSADASTSD